jgi:chaperone BCS1
MYEAVTPPKPLKKTLETTKPAKDDKDVLWKEIMTPRGNKSDLGPAEVKRISEEFAKKIPDGLFSPAEIQGFLLYRKTDPQKALNDADGWIEGFIKQKEAGSKVRVVQ